VTFLHAVCAVLGYAALLMSAGFALLAALAVGIWRVRFANRPPAPGLPQPPVTILKPLCGAEPGLHTHLRSFCQQDYPTFQIVFGVREPNDPALAVVERIVAEFPALSIDVVIDPQLHGDNYKTSNLLNMMRRARHDLLVIADSDAVVRPDYLGAVTNPLLHPDVGLVTCIYHGVPTKTIWSRLGAMYINEWFVPSVLLAWFFGHRQYSSGQTLCVRRDTLQEIGGLEAIANHIADDYRLGALIRGLGKRIVLSGYEVEVEHHEPTAGALVSHELRWMRTLHVVSPKSFRWMFLSFGMPVALMGLVFTWLGAMALGPAWLLLGVTALARMALYFLHRLRYPRSRHAASIFADLWLLPPRDLLLCWTWLRSFFASSIIWRGSEFNVDAHGVMRRMA
jgi:ceramide glucosyltransferase